MYNLIRIPVCFVRDNEVNVERLAPYIPSIESISDKIIGFSVWKTAERINRLFNNKLFVACLACNFSKRSFVSELLNKWLNFNEYIHSWAHTKWHGLLVLIINLQSCNDGGDISWFVSPRSVRPPTGL